MAEYVETSRIGGVLVVRFLQRGNPLWLGLFEIAEVSRMLKSLVETTDARAIVLNLAEVQDFGADGLMMLLKLQRQAGKKGIAFRLSNVSATLGEHIRIDRLDQILAIDPDEAAAIAAVANMDQKEARP